MANEFACNMARGAAYLDRLRGYCKHGHRRCCQDQLLSRRKRSDKR